MVNATTAAKVPCTSGKKSRHNTLHRKLWRDMRRSAMQFVAIILLCALGVWVYSGLDCTWRMLDLSGESYFAEQNLADFWVNGSSFSRADLTKMKHIKGVDALNPRTTMEFDTPALGNDVSLSVHAYDGDITINVPLIRQGEMLNPADVRGCLLEEQFAEAHGLNVGDTVTMTILNEDRDFVIRGIVLSPEHVVTSKEVSPDPEHYGFAILSSQALSQLPLNEVLIDISPDADADEVESAIEALVPSALILTQTTHGSTSGVRNHVSMFRNLSYVFPLLAFAVAAMIVLTTLTRMIENQRIQMGTLKALGYTDKQIRRHYLSYALYPSLFGAAAGLIIGQYTLPYVLWDMVAATYVFPARLHSPISLPAWFITVLAVVLSLGICLHAYNKAARECTASLLRPKPPKAGTRILLERIHSLWRRFSFNTKMVLRNLMRNKGRTAMALVGMLCCNMLIICTFGLQDSISYFIGEYYGGTLQYELRADLDSTAGTLESYQARLDAEQVEGIMEKSVSLRSDTQKRTTQFTVLKSNQTMIRLGKGHELLIPPEDGVIVSQKLADVMQISLGDHLEVWLPGETEALIMPCAGFADTNIGQGIYITDDYWQTFRKGDFAPTALLLSGVSDMCRYRLEEMDEVSAIKDPVDQYNQTMKIMDSTKGAFSILSGAALGLAFIICYNMGLMNFTERTRDYATLKVLGYHQKEIRRLMLRENDLTALLGVALGILPGILLTQVVLKSCESDSMVFASQVKPLSVLLASLITFAFTWFIEWLLTRKVRSIDMVEALKSVE